MGHLNSFESETVMNQEKNVSTPAYPHHSDPKSIYSFGNSAFFSATWYKSYALYFKDKSPEVPFHGITSPYSYFEVIWIFAPIQQEAKHDQEKISAEQK